MTDPLPNARRIAVLGASMLVCAAVTLSSGTAALAATSLSSSVSAAIKSAVTRRMQTELRSFESGVEKGTGSTGGTTGGKGHTKAPLEKLGEEVGGKLKGPAGTVGLEGPAGLTGAAGSNASVTAGAGLTSSGGTIGVSLPFQLSNPMSSSLATFTNSGPGPGVAGASAGGAGVMGTATGSSGVGILGVATAPALAGEFQGNVSVTGHLTVQDPSTGTIELEPGWSASTPPIAIKDPVGMVQLEGAVESTETSRIGVIPPEFLPSTSLNGSSLGLMAVECYKGQCVQEPISINTATGVVALATSTKVPMSHTLFLTGLSYLS